MSDPYLGEIRLVGFNFAPYGWALCQGQTLSISQNAALFSLIGTTYGGNGTTNFELPNLQSRVPVCFGQGAGLSAYVIGQSAGAENVTLNQSQMPMHTHPFTPAAGSVSIQAGNALGSTATPGGNYLVNGGDPGGSGLVAINFAPQAGAGTLGNIAGVTANLSGAIGTTGGSLPTPILQPYLALNFIIALQGIFPTRG